MGSISDPKCHEVTSEVLDVLMGPPPKEDLNLIRLKEAGLTLARRVFLPIETWPLKEANAYLSKYLSRVKNTKEGIGE